MNHDSYKQCGVTFQPGKIYLKNYWEKINVDIINWEKFFDWSDDHI